MNALTSPFASPIARLLAHKHALGVAYHRERGCLAEFERLTVGWSDDVLSETTPTCPLFVRNVPSSTNPHKAIKELHAPASR